MVAVRLLLKCLRHASRDVSTVLLGRYVHLWSFPWVLVSTSAAMVTVVQTWSR